MSAHNLRDKIRTENIPGLVGVAPIKDKIKERLLKWFGHVERRPLDALVRKIGRLYLGEFKQGKRIHKLTWINIVVERDIRLVELLENLVTNKARWRRTIHVTNMNELGLKPG